MRARVWGGLDGEGCVALWLGQERERQRDGDRDPEIEMGKDGDREMGGQELGLGAEGGWGLKSGLTSPEAWVSAGCQVATAMGAQRLVLSCAQRQG